MTAKKSTFRKEFDLQPELMEFLKSYGGMFGKLGDAEYASFDFGSHFDRGIGRFIATITLTPWKEVTPLGENADFGKMADECDEVIRPAPTKSVAHA